MKTLLVTAAAGLVLLQGCVAVPFSVPAQISMGFGNYGPGVYAGAPALAAQINPGYTLADVVAIVGYVNDRRGNGYRGAWRYGYMGCEPYCGNVSGAAVYDFYRWHVQSIRYWNRMGW